MLALLVLGGAAAAPRVARAQQGGEERAREDVAEGSARIREHFDPETARRILDAADAAAEAGAPRELVYEKALEGAAKGVPASRIVAAVEAFAERVGRGARLLGRRTDRSEVAAAAEALGRGVPAAEVTAMARGVAGRPLEVPLMVLADLVEAGVPAPDARALVLEAVRAGLGDPDLLDMEARVRGRMRSGAAPAEAAAGARAALRRGEGQGSR